MHTPIIFSIFILFIGFVCRQFNVKKKKYKTLKAYTQEPLGRKIQKAENAETRKIKQKSYSICVMGSLWKITVVSFI